MPVKSIIKMTHDLLNDVLQNGVTAVDATCGNGHDTLYLAGRVGERGRVYAFDIQEEAIAATEKRLSENGLRDRAVLIHDSHANLGEYLPETKDVRAAVFNLGYLPGGDTGVITEAATTVTAINQLAAILEPEGIIAIVVYPGHAGGDTEAAAVEKTCSSLPSSSFKVYKYASMNSQNPGPYLIAIEKRR